MNTIDDIKEIIIRNFVEENGSLSVVEGCSDLSMDIARVFFISANKYVVRGRHSHKECTQVLICNYGSIEIRCDDGVNKKNFLLNNFFSGLIIPPDIWSEQLYIANTNALTVLCSHKYDENDYIRDYNKFLISKKSIQKR